MTSCRDTIAFATEPLFASLANVLGKVGNLPQVPLPLKDYDMLDLEVTMGLIQMSSALEFVHGAELIHGNLAPESIVLTKNYEWRLAGFHFACHARYQNHKM